MRKLAVSAKPYHQVAPVGIKVTVLEPGAMKTDWAGSSMLAGRAMLRPPALGHGRGPVRTSSSQDSGGIGCGVMG